MRIAIIVASVLLLAALVPIGPGMAKELRDKESFARDIVVEQDIYTHGGWWAANNFQNTTVDGTDHPDDEPHTEPANDPEWIWLKDLSDDRARWNVVVHARGPVVAAIDVFEVRENDAVTDAITPKCVHHLVTDLYPGDGENSASYLARLLHITTDHHQLVAPGSDHGGNETTINLDPKKAPHGYILSIYPLAASNHETVTGTYKDNASSEHHHPVINYTVTATLGKVTVDDNGNQAQPGTPFSLGPIVSNLNECTSPGGLPGAPPLPSLGPGEVPELPTGVDDLLTGYLPE